MLHIFNFFNLYLYLKSVDVSLWELCLHTLVWRCRVGPSSLRASHCQEQLQAYTLSLLWPGLLQPALNMVRYNENKVQNLPPASPCFHSDLYPDCHQPQGSPPQYHFQITLGFWILEIIKKLKRYPKYSV